jgi:5'(3')-deoxyribonucleotidase
VEHFHQTAAAQTVAWLDYNGIPYFDLCFMSDKGAVEANLYIDDAPSNVLALLASDKDVIAFANSTNLGLQIPDRNRAANWTEVEERVMERFDLWTQQNP